MTDYQPLLARALGGLDRNTSETRRAVYDRARQALLNQLRSANPPMADADITRERLALEDAIRKTETEAVLAEPHSVRTPSAGRMPPPPARTPAAPQAHASVPRPPVTPRPAMPEQEAPEQEASAQEALPEETPASQDEGARQADAAPDFPAENVAPPPPSPPSRPMPPHGRRPERSRAPVPGAPGERARGAGRADDVQHAPSPHSPSPLPPPSMRPQGPGPRPRPMRPQRPAAAVPPGVKVQPARSNRTKFIVGGIVLVLLAGAGVAAIALRHRLPGGATTPPVAEGDQPKSSERITQAPDGQGRPSEPTNLDPAVAQRAVLYEENPGGGQQFQNFVGTAVWKTEAVNAPGRAPDLGLLIDVEIPDRKIGVTLKMRRNTDPSFPASHTIEVIFKLPPGDAFGGVADMRGIRAKGGETAQGTPIAAEVQKVKDGYFLLALPKIEEVVNLQLLRDRDWIDIPFVYANGRRAVLTFQKGTPGERALNEVLNSWGQGAGQSPPAQDQPAQNQNGGSQ